MNRIFSTILLSAVIEFVSDFLPIRETGSAKKYLRYITSLIIAISIIMPVWEFMSANSGGFFEKAELSSVTDGNYDLPRYIYVTESGVYEASESGLRLGENEIFCDLYIRECVQSISNSVKELLSDKLSIKQEDISVDIALDLTRYDSIEIICITLGLESANDYIKKDACDYIKSKFDCKTVAE